MKVHDSIRLLREQKNWSQEEMAERMGMSKNGYAKIERGESNLGVKRLQQIAEILEVSTEEISGGHKGTVMYGEDNGFLVFVVMFDNNEGKIKEGDVVTVTGLPYLLLESTVDLDNIEDMSVSDNRIVLNIATNIVKK